MSPEGWSYRDYPFARMPDSVIWDFRISHPAYRALSVLVSRCTNKGKCWPSIDLLTRDLGVSRSTVQRMLGELVGAGLIKVNYRTGRSSVFVLTELAKVYLPVGAFRSAPIALQREPERED